MVNYIFPRLYVGNQNIPFSLQDKWENFESFCVDKGLRVNRIAGDGFCFLKAVIRSLYLDHRYVISFRRLKEKITEHLIENSEKYVNFHGCSADKLVFEATEFFNDGKFTRDVVDILVQATADALKLKMEIYRRSPAGNIQCQIVESECPTMQISLQFVTSSTRNLSYTGANHYNSVTKVDPTANLDTTEPVTSQQATVSESGRNNTGSRSGHVAFDEISGNSPSLDSENENNVILETNELVIGGQSGDSLVELYLRPGTVFPTHLFDDVEPKVVNFLPPNINGNKYYHVKCDSRNFTKRTSDRRWWYMRTSSKKGLVGYRRVGTCNGSWECVNESCSYLSTEGKRNNWHFEFRNSTRCCYSCGTFASQVPCGARKLVQFSLGSEIAQVYHIGSHKCTLKPENK